MHFDPLRPFLGGQTFHAPSRTAGPQSELQALMFLCHHQ